MYNILFMDDDRDFLDTWAEFLAPQYRVLKACTVAEARRLLVFECVHLAILDISMEPGNGNDLAGLILAKEEAYRRLPKIILTGYPDYRKVRKVMSPALVGLPPAVEFLSKGDGPDALIDAVEENIARYVRVNEALRIVASESGRLSLAHLVASVDPALEQRLFPGRMQELDDLLRKLHPTDRELCLGRMLWTRAGRICVTSTARDAESVRRDALIVVGGVDSIRADLESYRKYAPKGERGALLSEHAETLHYGAYRLWLPGVDLEQCQSLREFYIQATDKQLRDMIRALLQEVLGAWRGHEPVLQEGWTLAQFATERLALDTARLVDTDGLIQSLQSLTRQSPRLGPTRLEWVGDTLRVDFPTKPTAAYPIALSCWRSLAKAPQTGGSVASPGLLTEENILVDQNGQPWLTDFRQAGLAPLLWDAAQLELVVRFACIQSTDLNEMAKFEERLVKASPLNAPLDRADLEQASRKAVGAIQEARQQSAQVAGDDWQPYYQTVQFQALAYLARLRDEVALGQQELARALHTLLALAMMPQGDSGALLDEEDETTAGIMIDRTDHRVWVDGRSVWLSDQELDVLCYLDRRANLVCSERDITEQGLHEEYLGNKQARGRIATVIGRIRAKVEFDRAQPRHIVNVRGEGYKLVKP